MWYLLAFFLSTGEMVDQDTWSRNKKFPTLESCTAKKLEYQKLIDAAYVRGGSTGERVVFDCLRGKEMAI